jgi:hypothetical protein
VQREEVTPTHPSVRAGRRYRSEQPDHTLTTGDAVSSKGFVLIAKEKRYG